MADSFNKKNLQQKKAKKKRDKLEKREERKTNNDKGKSLNDMIAYVDEFGNITDVPPENQNREEVVLEDIVLGAAPLEEETVFTGVLTLFFSDKSYGFITEQKSKESIFVHSSGFTEPIVEKDRVVFEKQKTPKGTSAVNVKKA